MFGRTRWNPFEDMFTFQRELDRVFDQFWSELPTRTAGTASPFQVNSTNDEWRIEVPLPGVDPQCVNLEVAGNTMNIRVAERDDQQGDGRRYQQTFTVPHFLDLDRIKASHYHGMLRLTLPLKESVKPRRIAIEPVRDQKQLTAA